jgi:hypothetical protein
MQTFLPYYDYDKSMKCLDPKRLGNQVYREALTLIKGGWANHPASKMWRGYEHHLALYALAGLRELKRRGHSYPHHKEFFEKQLIKFPDTGPPSWLGNEKFHAAHRSQLLAKDFDWYKQFNWSEKPGEINYVWPTKEV